MPRLRTSLALTTALLACGPDGAKDPGDKEVEQELGSVEREKFDILMVVENSQAMADSPSFAWPASVAMREYS